MPNTQELSKQVKSKELLSTITPDMALQMMKEGNDRFVQKDMIEREHEWHIRETIDSQHPFAIVLGCIDSRVEPSILFDQGIGDLFIARIAGNIINQDILGSMEYACAVSGSKLVLVLGHTSCGAVKGAIDNVVLDNLSPSLRHIQLAAERVKTEEGFERTAKNLKFVDLVSYKNVEQSINDIRNQSPILRNLEEEGKIIIAGAVYDHSTGAVHFC
ncbi:MAG: carbonic anhydrase [Bacteroidetes bacterium 4572_112]|nr:MAG: carbonic anhydrase [Bacteroidetes bacterium 4572_112]